MFKVLKRIALALLGIVALLLVAVAVYAANVFAGMHVVAQTNGTLTGTGVSQPVALLRDDRGIPHIRANSLHDLFFAQGFAEGSDRLFQMDLVRRFVYGRLAEVLGSATLATDERARDVDVRGIVSREWQHMDGAQRGLLQAFSDGVNTAIARQPVPVEFRLLAYRMEPWTPQDSLAVGFATVLDLTDTWKDIVPRDDVWRRLGEAGYDAYYPLTDWKYDSPTAGRDTLAHTPDTSSSWLLSGFAPREPKDLGSNEWAVGGARSTNGHALLANDPHLDLAIPGIWYLVDLQAPNFHAAGVSIAGTPGVILGHNDRIAWGATNGTVTSMSVFDLPTHLPARYQVTETFHVRFSHDVTQTYYRAPREFAARAAGSLRSVLVRWGPYDDLRSPVTAFLNLNRANSVKDAERALAAYPGPTQNFVFADVSGAAGYHLSGEIPNDPAWARWVHPSSDLAKTYAPIPFDRLPAVAPSRDAIVFTANNKMYGDGYPYRLSPAFTPPYRAYRIAQLLRARKKYYVAYFTQMQNDTFSPADLEFARAFAAVTGNVALRTWDGRFDTNATGAVVERAERFAHARPSLVYTLERARAGSGKLAFSFGDSPVNEPSPRPWRDAGAVRIEHPLSLLGITFLNGALLPGDGEKYTIHVQQPAFSQSFRTVWDVGNWDAGGIVIPSGESGEPGSPHYRDLSPTWISGTLVPLPFSTRAVDAATRERLKLAP